MSKQGDNLFKKAEKAFNKYTKFGNEKKLTNAIDLFKQSADAYQSTNDWVHAGDAYAKAADCLQNNNQLNEAAIASTNAGKMYSKSPETAKKAYESFSLAARFYRENSKPINAAQLLCESGKFFDGQKDSENAIQCYKDAAQIYDDENKPIQAANQMAIIADILCSQNKWIDASNVYKDVAARRFSDNLTKISALEFCMKSVICRMAGDDIIGAESFMNGYLVDFPAWEKSREYRVLCGLDHAINNHDSDEFSKIVKEYDQIQMLDPWMSNSLQVVKQLLDNGEEEEIC